MSRPSPEGTEAPRDPTPAGIRELDTLFPLVYAELRRLAHRRLRGERQGHTLDTTALVHEAYLKLAKLDRLDWKGQSHFFSVAAQAMRRVLVDYAIRRNAQKRGGGRSRVPLEQVTLPIDDHAVEILALNEALGELQKISPRQCRVVECRFFAGMSIPETAEALEVSPATVKLDWTHARAWLNRALEG